MALVVHLEGHVLDREVGLWCDACALPSRVAASVALVNRATLRTVRRFHVDACQDCGERVVVWEPSTLDDA